MAVISSESEYGISLILFFLLAYYFWRQSLGKLENQTYDLEDRMGNLYSQMLDEEKTMDKAPIKLAGLEWLVLIVVFRATLYALAFAALLEVGKYALLHNMQFYKPANGRFHIFSDDAWRAAKGIKPEPVPNEQSSSENTAQNRTKPIKEKVVQDYADVQREYAKVRLLDTDSFTDISAWFLVYIEKEIFPIIFATLVCILVGKMYISLMIPQYDYFDMAKLRGHILTIHYLLLVIFVIIFIAGTFIFKGVTKILSQLGQ
jgi:hypothetical protein